MKKIRRTETFGATYDVYRSSLDESDECGTECVGIEIVFPGESVGDRVDRVGIQTEARVDLVAKVDASSEEIGLEKEVDFITLSVEPFQFCGSR